MTKLSKFTRFFVKNYQISILLIIFLVIGGLSGYFQLPREGIPEIDIPITVVSTVYVGATPQDVETGVTKKIEAKVASIESVEEFYSNSAESYSSVVVTFKADADLDKSVDELRRAVTSITDLPSEAGEPEVMEIEIGGPDMVLNIVTNGDMDKFADYVDEFKNTIENSDNVSRVDVLGDEETKVEITLDLAKVEKSGISYDQISGAVKAANLSFPGGSIEENEVSRPIQVVGKYKNIANIKNTIVGAGPNGLVRLSDLATVESVSVGMERKNITGYQDGDDFVSGETVSLAIYAEKNSDIVKVKEGIEENIQGLRDDGVIPEDLGAIYVYDIAHEVSKLLSDLFTSAWQGLIIILIVLFIFISWRSSVVAAIIIPLVLLAAFMVLNYIGLTLNFFTLFALILSLGIVIDNAIVVVEGIQRYIRKGLTRKEASIKTISELGGAIVSATATTVLVFIPMMFLGGITGEIVKFIPYTVVITLLASFIIAISLTPFLSRFFLKRKATTKQNAGKYLQNVIDSFGKLIGKLLKNKKTITAVIAVVILLFAGSMYLATQVEMNLWPQVDDDEKFQISIKMPNEATDDFKNDKVDEVSEIISGLYDTNEKVNSSLVSFAQLSFFGFGSDDTDVLIANTKPLSESKVKTSEITSLIQEELSIIEDVEISVAGFTSGPPQSTYPIEIQIANEDFETLENSALALSEYMESIEGVKFVDDGVDGEKITQIRIALNSDKVAQNGLSQIQVAMLVRNIYNSEKVSSFIDPETNLSQDIEIEFTGNEDLESIKNLKVGTTTLSALADISEVQVLKSINHFDQHRYIEVSAAVEDTANAVEITKQIEDYLTIDKLTEFGLEQGSVTFRGEFDSEADAIDDFAELMILALIMVFAVLVFQFKSLILPFVVMLAIPLSFIGVFPGLLITGNPISFLVLIGLVVLVGIVVNNSIILIDRFNKIKLEGLDNKQTVIEGVKERFRPIVSTTLTTIAGILPLTIASFYWRGMGTAIIFGLIASSIFVLTVIPVVYYMYLVASDRLSRKKTK